MHYFLKSKSNRKILDVYLEQNTNLLYPVKNIKEYKNTIWKCTECPYRTNRKNSMTKHVERECGKKTKIEVKQREYGNVEDYIEALLAGNNLLLTIC